MEFKEVEGLIRAALEVSERAPALIFVVVLVSAAVLLSQLLNLIDKAAAAVLWLWGSISSLFYSSEKKSSKREFIDRRSQFLRVLRSDLASIAKAEAWNDQQFTDLEAEVEIEGGYYNSSFYKLIRKKSYGLRKEASLIGAIDKSLEKSLLLTGDPGAGKSVALRHLANQMIDRSISSNKEISIIPLYINLREFRSSNEGEIDARAIKNFVIDNTRRGDADTADYIRENWDDFHGKGVWFFLFDSFDEIPAVMHSSSSDEPVRKYGDAIRKFMDGMGNCRSVLASREYKSPEGLSWPKLRIMALDERKQEELVNKTFLSSSQKTLVLRAVSLSESFTYKNPLFLALLCRYVRKFDFSPKNEHELLLQHVESLAQRDVGYVKDKWGFTAAELLAGASELATLFATSKDLGLAPTIDEIQLALSESNSQSAAINASALIEALTYVKIGRTDVQSPDAAVRRFAFGHRRYQECLYARVLVTNIEAYNIEDVLLDVDKREYVVALLQMADDRAISSIIGGGAVALDRRISSISIRPRRMLGEDVLSYDWADRSIEHLLSVFLEAKRYNPSAPWDLIERPVEKMFGRLWNRGDFYDRRKIIQYCGVGSQETLARRLEFAMNSGIESFSTYAIDACRFLVSPSPEFSSWVRKHVGSQLLVPSKKFELLKWEAIASQLPSSYRMDVVIQRARSLRPIVRYTNFISAALFNIFYRLRIKSGEFFRLDVNDGLQSVASAKLSGIPIFYTAGIFAAIAVTLYKDGPSYAVIVVSSILFVLSIFLMMAAVRVICLHVGVKISFRVFLDGVSKLKKQALGVVVGLLISAIIMLSPGLIFLGIFRHFGFFSHVDSADLAFISSIVFLFLVGLSLVVYSTVRQKELYRSSKIIFDREGQIYKSMSKASRGSEVASIALYAMNTNVKADDVRHSIAYLSVVYAIRNRGELRREPAWIDSCSPSEIRVAISRLLKAFEESPLVARARGS